MRWKILLQSGVFLKLCSLHKVLCVLVTVGLPCVTHSGSYHGHDTMGLPALHMPWSWHVYCFNHCTRTCYLHHIALGIALQIGQSGASEVQNWAFLSTNLISFWQSHGIVLVIAAPAQEMDSPVNSEIRRKVCKMLGISALEGYQVEALQGVHLNKHDMLVCVPTGSRKSPCFEGICTMINHMTGRERAA